MLFNFFRTEGDDTERHGEFTNYLKCTRVELFFQFLRLLVGYQEVDVPVSGEVSEAGER